MKINNLNIKVIFNSLLIVVVSSLIGLLLLMISFSLPDERIQKNVAGSVWMINEEGLYPERIYGLNSTRMDNWTDALIMNNLSFSDDDYSLFERVLEVPRAESRDNPIYSLYTYYFEDYVDVTVETYTRYWHGYITFLRPLFMLGDYSIVRFLYFIVHFTILAVFLRLLEKKVGLYPSIAFFATYLCVTGFVTPFSLQYSTIMFLILFSGIFLLLCNDFLIQRKWMKYYFLLLGIITVYLDYLTYPIAVLGINLILYILLNKNKSEIAKELIGYIIMWFAGYGGMWAMKWIISTIVLGGNIFSDVFAAMRERAGNTGLGNDLTPVLIIQNNLKYLNNKPVIACLLLTLLGGGLSKFAFVKKNKSKHKINMRMMVSLCLISTLPFIWVSVLLNHSFIHEYFTYRAFMPAVFALLLLPECVNTKRDCDKMVI